MERREVHLPKIKLKKFAGFIDVEFNADRYAIIVYILRLGE